MDATACETKIIKQELLACKLIIKINFMNVVLCFLLSMLFSVGFCVCVSVFVCVCVCERVCVVFLALDIHS